LRIDSGELSTKTSLFGSYSYTDADKWKGKGELGGRFWDFSIGMNMVKELSYDEEYVSIVLAVAVLFLNVSCPGTLLVAQH